ncbi:MAG: ribonuclease HII [Oscillospiraceae bacterium]|nr:ribonuclease HII [Oscillospiraceae bacterium]
MIEVDRELLDSFVSVCGVDEAGRGPLAGPVFAAAVILPPGTVIEGLNDSKKLSEKKREALYGEICEKASEWSVASASEKEIDELNILQATFLAMRRAVEGVPSAAFALIDGNRTPPLALPCRCVVGGDGKYACIAAASIIAKVSRDRYMCALAERYPQYAFEKHKGYGTALHYRLIRQYGPSPAHRLSFLKKMH